MPRLQAAPAKHWVFTRNNPTLDPIRLLLAFAEWPLSYALFQLETAESGTPHYQGYLEFKAKMRLTAILRLPGAAGMHLEKRRGTREQARDYARKEDTREDGPWEYGIWSPQAQGSRSDLSACTDMLANGSSLVDVAVAQPATFVRYHRGFNALVNIQPRSREEPPAVTLLYGPPGVGKTRMVRDGETVEDLWVSPPGSPMKWFDEYQNQEAALFDEFDGKASKVPLSTCLQILDRYAIRVPTKGSHVWWTPKRIFVTTNYHPRDWYEWSSREVQYPALRRRFTNVVYWCESALPTHPLLLTPESQRWEGFWANELD